MATARTLVSAFLLWSVQNYHMNLGRAASVLTTPAYSAEDAQRHCFYHGNQFTKTFSQATVLHYCDNLDSHSNTYKELQQTLGHSWSGCHDFTSWSYADFGDASRYLLRLLFRHHLDWNRDRVLSSWEYNYFFRPIFTKYFIPKLNSTVFKDRFDIFKDRRSVKEEAFITIIVSRMQVNQRLVYNALFPDLDGDGCVTRQEFARAVCRKKVLDRLFYFNLADLDESRTVTAHERQELLSVPPVTVGEKDDAEVQEQARIRGFFEGLEELIDNFDVEYFQTTSFPHDDMMTVNELNLYLCLKYI